LDDARAATESSIHRRLIDIAQHYQMLAAAEARDADRLGNERRQKSKSTENGRCSGKTEIQILRLKLRMFASQQPDQTVRLQCLAVDKALAELLEGNELSVRHLLAGHVQQLERALRRSTENAPLDGSK